MRRLITLILTLGLFPSLNAQTYEVVLVPGWKAELIQVIGDNIYQVGSTILGPSIPYYGTVINKIDGNKIVASDTLYHLQKEMSFHSAFAVISNDTVIHIGGYLVEMGNDTIFSALYGYYGNDSFTVEKRNLGFKAFTTALAETDESIIRCGLFNTTNQAEDLETGYILNNKGINVFRCNGYSSYGGCQFLPEQILVHDNALYMAARTYSGARVTYSDPIVIKTDLGGKEIWRLDLGKDSTTGSHLVIAPLANGNFLGCYADYYYKPYKGLPPNHNRDYPVGNPIATYQFVEFTASGHLVRRWDIHDYPNYKYRFIRKREAAFNNHLIVSELDSSILIAGNTRAEGINTTGDQGYLLKINKNGKLVWFRLYEININAGKGLESTFINGIHELPSGHFALLGEYRSQKDDSFPKGISKGVILFVDEFGCLEPGCEKTDGVKNSSRPYEILIYPNPTNGEIKIKGDLPEKSTYSLLSLDGRTVSTGKLWSKMSIYIERSGSYVLVITAPDGKNYHKIIAVVK